MIRYFFDTEFSARSMLSASMVRDDGECLYLVVPEKRIEHIRRVIGMDPWVEENVIPILLDVPPGVDVTVADQKLWGHLISDFIYRGDEVPQIFADWMSDIADLMRMFITGPGTGVPMGHQTHMVCLRHLDVYPTTLKGAVQHNAAWDAFALKRWLNDMESK